MVDIVNSSTGNRLSLVDRRETFIVTMPVNADAITQPGKSIKEGHSR